MGLIQLLVLLTASVLALEVSIITVVVRQSCGIPIGYPLTLDQFAGSYPNTTVSGPSVGFDEPTTLAVEPAGSVPSTSNLPLVFQTQSTPSSTIRVHPHSIASFFLNNGSISNTIQGEQATTPPLSIPATTTNSDLGLISNQSQPGVSSAASWRSTSTSISLPFTTTLDDSSNSFATSVSIPGLGLETTTTGDSAGLQLSSAFSGPAASTTSSFSFSTPAAYTSISATAFNALTSSAPLATTSTTGSTSVMSTPVMATPTCAIAPAVNITCPAANGTIYTPEGQCVSQSNSYVVNCGQNLDGAMVTIVGGVDDVDDCIGSCQGHDTCVAVAFNNVTNICYEKSTVDWGNVTVNSTDLIFAFNVRYAVNAGAIPAIPDTTPIASASTVTTTVVSTSVLSRSVMRSAISSTTPTSAEPTCTAQLISNACPYCDNQTISLSADGMWQTNCNRVYGGLSMQATLISKRQSLAQADDCLAQCGNTTSCAAFSWYSGQCSLFTSVPSVWSAITGAISARKATVLIDIG